MNLLPARKLRALLLCACIGVCSCVSVCSFAASARDATAPITLRQAITAALAGNPELQSFAFELRAADARSRQAALRPPLELAFDAENLLGTGDSRLVDAAEFTLAISSVIELGAKREARVAVGEATRAALETERAARQLDVLAEVTRRFIGLATRQAQLQLAQRTVELAQQAVAAATRRVNAAKAPLAELNRANVGLARARLDEARVVASLDAARRQLAASWGETRAQIDGQTFTAVQAELFVLPDIGGFEPLRDRLATNRDALRFASAARLREAELRVAERQRTPDIALSGGVRRLQDSGDLALVLSASVPLGSAARARAPIAEAEALRDLIGAERKAALIRAEGTLYQLHRELTRSVAAAKTLRDEVLPQAQAALNETEYAYERGRYGFVELTDAQREFVALQEALIEAASEAHTLSVEIERLTNAALKPATP